ncbi:glycine N-acyltransferase-like protein 3 [Betta splendens]|uniref:Glycine N-acyltransferase-like protein n=1 Tax=Betta splendens TaxID=158456 RepID=A0A6P7PGJ4_BETSP|nr:glycine N-acyltransferase-like protein 3 [Betta splendens]
MELTGDQLKMAESQLKSYLPRSQQAYGCLVLKNRLRSDPAKILVDAWPKFSVIIYKPLREQEGDSFKDLVVFANDDAVLEKVIRTSSVIDWTSFNCVGLNVHQMEVFNAVASEMNVPTKKLSLCRIMTMEDVSRLPTIDSSGISLSSLDESHIALINRNWKFGNSNHAIRMIRNMVTNFPSCCVLDAEGRPVSWILTYASCSMGMLYTLPEHRGKGYAKAVIVTLAKRLQAQDYPVYCFIEEENMVSYKLFKSLGFTHDPSYRETWGAFNYHLKHL